MCFFCRPCHLLYYSFLLLGQHFFSCPPPPRYTVASGRLQYAVYIHIIEVFTLYCTVRVPTVAGKPVRKGGSFTSHISFSKPFKLVNPLASPRLSPFTIIISSCIHKCGFSISLKFWIRRNRSNIFQRIFKVQNILISIRIIIRITDPNPANSNEYRS